MTALAVNAHRTTLANPTPQGTPRLYARSLLVDAARHPMRYADLVVGENYIFHYPYVTTPCFLLNLGEPIKTSLSLSTEDGRSYQWSGGVGPDSSVVAFSAICAHKMTHPARAVSFINYRHERVRFEDSANKQREGSQVIFCCSERSVYDVRKGARVIGGPAKQPLASILLEYDSVKDQLFAIGTRGGEMFDKFFSKFDARLQLEYRTTKIDDQVAPATQVLPLDEYCANKILC